MQQNIVLNNLANTQDLQRLRNYLSEIFRLVDPIYTTTAPNGNILAQRQRIALYDNSGTFTVWVNTDGGTTWQQVDKDTTTDEKVKSSSDDPSADYLDGKVAKSIVIASEKLELSGDAAAPGNSKYYGTDSGGTKGFLTSILLGALLLSLLPATNNDIDLGSDAKEWKDLWLDGIAYLDAVIMHGNLDFNDNQAINFIVENRTDDTGMTVTGQMWFRTDV